MEFGEKLKHARETKGITQQTLASHLFVTRQAVSRWECGARFPDLLTARKLSEYLEVSLDELLSPDETTKCIEENPIIESPTILRVQTSLYGFCKCQYKNVGFIQNNYVEKPTFLFCIFSLRSSVKCCI